MRPNIVRTEFLAPAAAALIAFGLMPFTARAEATNYIGSPWGASPASGMTWASASVWFGPNESFTYPYNDCTTSGANPGANGQAGFVNVDFRSRPWQGLPEAGGAQGGGTFLGGGQFYALLPLDRPWSQLQLSLDFRTAGLPTGLSTEDALAWFWADCREGFNVIVAGFDLGAGPGPSVGFPLVDGWTHVAWNLGAVVRPPALIDPRGHDDLILFFNMSAAANYLPAGSTERIEFNNLRIDAVPDSASSAALIGLALLALGLARRFQR